MADQLWGPRPFGLVELPDLLTNNPFDSWWWRNRKPIALGTVGVLGIGALVIIGKVLR